MSETRTKSRALLAAADLGGWSADGCEVFAFYGGQRSVAGVVAKCYDERAATLIAAAPTLIATLCDEADAERRRVVEAEAGAAAMREALTAMRDARNAAIANGHHEGTALHLEFYARMVQKDALDGSAGRAILAERDALRAERDEMAAKVRRLEGRVARVCRKCYGSGLPSDHDGPPRCDACRGSGAVIVEAP